MLNQRYNHNHNNHNHSHNHLYPVECLYPSIDIILMMTILFHPKILVETAAKEVVFLKYLIVVE